MILSFDEPTGAALRRLADQAQMSPEDLVKIWILVAEPLEFEEYGKP
jgi:hypothetical protein